jgi:hypothetical protein
MSRQVDPYKWRKRSGLAMMPDLRAYASFVLPLVGRSWEADGVKNFSEVKKVARDETAKPFKFSAARGPVSMEETRKFVDYVESAIGYTITAKNPYQWVTTRKLLHFQDAWAISAHVEQWLAKLT